MNRIYVVLTAVGVLAVAGCGGSSTGATKRSASPSASATTSETYEQCSDGQLRVKCDDATTPPAVEETTPPADEPSIAKVGATQWFTYEDGLKVQVTKLTRKKIGPYASGGSPGGTAVVVTVTIRNGSGKAFDSSLVDVKVAHGPNGDQAEQVFDSGIEEFSGTIPNGRVRTAQYEFAVPKAHYGQVQVEVAPSFDHNSSIFEGAAK